MTLVTYASLFVLLATVGWSIALLVRLRDARLRAHQLERGSGMEVEHHAQLAGHEGLHSELGAQAPLDQCLGLTWFIGVEALDALGLERHVDAGAVAVVLPAVIAAADAVVLGVAVVQRHAAVLAELLDAAETAGAVTVVE